MFVHSWTCSSIHATQHGSETVHGSSIYKPSSLSRHHQTTHHWLLVGFSSYQPKTISITVSKSTCVKFGILWCATTTWAYPQAVLSQCDVAIDPHIPLDQSNTVDCQVSFNSVTLMMTQFQRWLTKQLEWTVGQSVAGHARLISRPVPVMHPMTTTWGWAMKRSLHWNLPIDNITLIDAKFSQNYIIISTYMYWHT